MASSILSVRMDSQLKKSLDEFCDSVGMNTSVAINMFAKAVVREQRLPFEVTTDAFYNLNNMAYISRIIDRIEAGQAKLTEHQLIEESNE